MVTVTIDTNSINLARREHHLNQLEEWHKTGLIEIKRTATLTEELRRNLGALGEARLRKAEGYEEGGDSRAFVMRRSRHRGGDTLRGPTAVQWVSPISEILFPQAPFHQLAAGHQRDVLHLAIHKLHDWDYFVTKDKGILRRQQQLEDKFDIHALSPEEAVGVIGRALKEAGST